MGQRRARATERFPNPHESVTTVNVIVNPITLHVLAVVFLATLIRSTFGFGEALIAVPLLALRIPVKVAAPLAVLLSITVATVVILQDWRKVHVRTAGWLVLWSALGIPLGVLLLTTANARLVKAVLGLVIVAFSAYSLLDRAPLQLKRDRPLWLMSFGFCAGVLGGAYGMNGPPLVIYGSLRRWSTQHFRATLQGYFLPASLIGLAGYWLAGLWVHDVTRYYLLSLPVALTAILLGGAISRRLHSRAFFSYAYVGLLVIGIMLLLQSAGK